MSSSKDQSGEGAEGRTPAVTQKLLTEFLQLERQAKRFKELREYLIEVLEAGFVVEPGPLSVEIQRRPVQLLTAKHLIQELDLGPEEVEYLRSTAQPTPYRYVIITGSTQVPRGPVR